MFKNVASKFVVFAFDATTNVPKTGDAANITAYVSKDYGAVTVLADTSATEMDATNAPGYYLFDAAQGETNADFLLVSAKSATANIKVIGAPAGIYTRPTTGWLAPATAGRTLNVDASGRALSDVDTIKTQPVTCGAGVTVLASVGTAATSTAQTGDSYGLANGASGFVAIKTQTAAIEVDTADIQSRIPAALTGDGNIKADTLRIGGTLQTAKDVGAAVPAAAAGASGGLLISGSNSGTTTFGALTVTGATTLTGAVSLGSTLGVTGTVTFSAFTVTNALTMARFVVSGNSVNPVVLIENLHASGDAVNINTSGEDAVRLNGGVDGNALSLIGNSLNGLYISSTGTDAMLVQSTGGNGDAIQLTPHGTGTGLRGDITGNIAGTLTNVETVLEDVTVGTVSSGAITAASFAAGAINAAAIGADAITAAKIADGAIDAATFATGAINAAAIASDAIAAAKIATGAITSAKFAAGAIDAAAVADGAIDAATFAAGAINAAAIAADAITAAKIADGAIDAATFAAGAINAAAVADGAIDAATFAAGAINAAAIADAAIDRATFAADTGLQSVRSNTAQAGAGTTITLDASASAVDDFYNNSIVYLTGGTGAGQARTITDYVGATKVATVATWGTNPDNTSTFAILPNGAVTASIAAADIRSAVGLASANLDTQLAALPTAAENAAEADTVLSGSHGAGTWGSAGGGTGARSVTITVNDGATVLENARVRFTEGLNTFLVLTNASGIATFALDDATYAVTVTKPGYTFTPTTMIVNGTETATYSMTAVAAPAAPSDVSLCRLYGYLETLDGLPAKNITFTVRLSTAAGIKSDKVIHGRTINIKTNEDGQIASTVDGVEVLYHELQRNDLMTPNTSTYLVNASQAGMVDVSMTLAAATKDIASLIS